MTAPLLDGNVLVALCLAGHLQHVRVARWFADSVDSFATCSVTQGTLVRMHMRFAEDGSAAAAWRTLRAVTDLERHVYWSHDLSYVDVPHKHLQGPKQVTDAWLAELARRQGGRLATLDGGLQALHQDVAFVVPPLLS